MNNPNKRGRCHKNGTIKKQGLTQSEELFVARLKIENAERWKKLLSLNKWKKTK